jgi:hypothetical protein
VVHRPSLFLLLSDGRGRHQLLLPGAAAALQFGVATLVHLDAMQW